MVGRLGAQHWPGPRTGAAGGTGCVSSGSGRRSPFAQSHVGGRGSGKTSLTHPVFIKIFDIACILHSF